MPLIKVGSSPRPATVITSTRSGICPLCPKYIAKNSSRISPLPYAIPPLTFDGREFFEGGHYNYDGKPVSLKPRNWAHHYCAPKFDDLVARYRIAAAVWEPEPWSDWPDADARPTVLSLLP